MTGGIVAMLLLGGLFMFLLLYASAEERKRAAAEFDSTCAARVERMASQRPPLSQMESEKPESPLAVRTSWGPLVAPGQQGPTYAEIDDFCGSPHRQKYAKFKTALGYFVRSRAELSIVNYLAANEIAHIYEVPLTVVEFDWVESKVVVERVFPDFFLRDYGIFIEFHHNNMDEDDEEKQRRKRMLYRRNNIPVVWMDEDDLCDIGKFVARVPALWDAEKTKRAEEKAAILKRLDAR